MNIRFDDSLSILARVVADSLGAEQLSAGIVLRDISGRLAFFSSENLDERIVDTLAQRLREELGPYARTDRVLAAPEDFGAAKVLGDPVALSITVVNHRIRLIDRRLIGADWLRHPAEVAPPPPRMVFASLKGGVGRSTSLAVAAADLAARGLRVLALDLDLEAPGLGPMLLDETTLPEFGLLDALVENGLSGLDDIFLADLIGPSVLAQGRGRIDVIPVLGRRSLGNPAEVLAKLARAYAEDVGAHGEVATFLDQVQALMNRFSDSTRYDAILVDARAGLHETTASAVMGLGAEVFLFGRDEPQTFQGFRVLLAHLARFVDPDRDPPEWLSRLTLVQGHAPGSADAQLAFANKCRDIVEKSGLGPRQTACGQVSPPLTGGFGDIPWDDSIPDEEVLPNDDWGVRGPVAVLDDPRFRAFDPQVRRDLLAEQLYQTSFGSLLELVQRCATPDRGDS